MSCRALLIASLLISSVGRAAPPLAPGVVAFVDVNVVSPDRPGELRHQTVLVRGERIVAVGPVGKVMVPAAATRVAGHDRWLIPGLSDMHAHLASPIELPLYVANGVTTVFNLDGRPAHLRWRRAVTSRQLLGPTIYTTGPIINRTMSPAEAERLVAEQADAGYDAIKIYNGVGKDEYPHLTQAAQRRGLLLMGHVARAPGFAATLAAGQSIAHMEELTYTFFNPRGDDAFAHIVFDESRIAVAARMTAAAGVFITPTLSMFHDIVRQATELDTYLTRPELAYLSPWVRAGLQPGANRYDKRYSAAELAVLQRSLEFQRRLTRAMVAAGVPLLTGTDATFLGPVAGFSLHAELEELVASGLTPAQALRAATVNPARYLRRTDTRGAIGVGQRADLVLLTADPLLHMGASRAIAGVMLAGRWLDRPRLDAIVQAIPGAYARELEEVIALLTTEPARAVAFLEEHDPLDREGAAALMAIARTSGAARMLEVVRALCAAAPGSELASEDAQNTLGYTLAGAGRLELAGAILQGNVERFPRSANARDSLGEVLAKGGEMGKAVAAYREALQIDAHYANADFARRFIAEHGAR
jgi:imidazolonepropionase-like amidohydrolase